MTDAKNEAACGASRSDAGLGVTADGIAYRLARELEDLIELASSAMRKANEDGAEYDVDGELAPPNLALSVYRDFVQCVDIKSAGHACALNRALDGACLVCGSNDDAN